MTAELEQKVRTQHHQILRLTAELVTLRAQVNEAFWRLGIGGRKYEVCDECIQGQHDMCQDKAPNLGACVCLHTPPTEAETSWRNSELRAGRGFIL